MSKPKKDAKYLNVYIHRDVYDRFSKFCEKVGQNKSVASERALVAYMDKMQRKELKGKVTEHDKESVRNVPTDDKAGVQQCEEGISSN